MILLTTPRYLCRRVVALLLSLLSLLMPPLATGALAYAAEPQLQPSIESALRREGLAGAVWSTAGAGGVASIGAAGLKNTATGERMAPDSKVHVGSVAKTVLAMGVLRLVTEGKLSLDTPVAPLLPALVIDNPWNASDPVRVRHLLAHTSGLDNIRFWQLFSMEPRADTPLVAAFAGDPSLLRVKARPGSRYAYSSMGYALLGMLIEAASGKRYEHYLDTKILAPLGMADSTFEFVGQDDAAADKRLATGISSAAWHSRRWPCICVRPRSSPRLRPTWAASRSFCWGTGRCPAPVLRGWCGRTSWSSWIARRAPMPRWRDCGLVTDWRLRRATATVWWGSAIPA